MTRSINLIPHSGIQFWTVPIDLDRVGRLRRSFWEEPSGTYPDGSAKVVLRPLVETGSGRLGEPVSGRFPPEAEIYQIGRKQVIETMRRQWVPLPYFKTTRAGAEERHERGPANWARGRLSEGSADQPAGWFSLSIAFDTTLEAIEDGRYNAPTPDDSQAQELFTFAHRPEDIGWFLNEAWIGDWLGQMLGEKRAAERAGRRSGGDEALPACEHYAIFQTFLAMLAETEAMPRVQMLHAGREAEVEVDLVLDLGNSRSCGILIEEYPGQGLNMSNSYELVLRDLSQPECKYAEPFPSKVEFARASFGRDRLSRLSGRLAAFQWPNPVRTGNEAERLAGSRTGNEGLTGLSSPKRYLWDRRPAAQGWRFNGKAMDASLTDPPVNGPFRTMLNEAKSLQEEDRPAATVSGPAVFSRSLLFTFMLTEIILQAMMQMNSPFNRIAQQDATRPRRLRSVMLTMPPGMPVAEQKIFRNRAETAIELACTMRGKGDLPRLRAELDEATATQIVWLHNEVTERLGGNVDALFELYGRSRPGGDEAPSIRLASIDIGGGTTDLMITTFVASEGGAFRPRQNFRESFKVAGDDVLEAVITRSVLPPIEAAMSCAHVPDARAALNRALAQDHAGQSAQDRQARRLFVSTVLEPAAIEVLRRYEEVAGRTQGELARFRLGDVVRGDPEQVARSMAYLTRQARAAGAADEFDPSQVEVKVETGLVEAAVSHTLGSVIADLGEVVWAYDCDALLLSGRPSRLRRVVDMVTAAMPLPPHAIVPMHRYRVGSQYPFKDGLDRIVDPKTTVAVGAALCVQAQGRLQNFHMRTQDLSMRSTARIIGEMDLSNQVRTKNVLLHNVDLDGPPSEDDVAFTIRHFEGKTQLGFRQLPIERWPATPLYILEFATAKNVARLALPLSVKLRRKDIRERDEERNDFANREQFKVDEITDSEEGVVHPSVVQLRLQTLRDVEGYWRDTGRLSAV